MMGPPAAVPRCQVEGCHVVLANAKDYHRRYKVREMQAPKVAVLGLEQRFCHRCSRIHVVSEFDDSKRSCRRRLAGHNERRRKRSHDSLPGTLLMTMKSPSPFWIMLNHLIRIVTEDQSSEKNYVIYELRKLGDFRTYRRRREMLSLLSSRADSWISPSDLSLRFSAALPVLIAEDRAAILARQLILDREWHLHHHAVQQHPSLAEPYGWDRFPETGAQVILDVMQASSSALGKTKEEKEECSELWNSLEGREQT